MNTPSLTTRPLLAGTGPLWNVLSDDQGVGFGICTNHSEPLRPLLDAEGADESVAAFLLAELKFSGFSFFNCFMRKKIELEEKYAEAGESDVCYRGQVGGFFSPLDRTLEIPGVSSELLSLKIVQGLCRLLRTQHPLWRIAFLGPNDVELILYPDCVRMGDTICVPESCGTIISSWKQQLWEAETSERNRCANMEIVLRMIGERWPQSHDLPKVLRVSSEGKMKTAWTVFPGPVISYESRSEPLGSTVGRVVVDRGLKKYPYHETIDNGIETCCIECELYETSVATVKFVHRQSGVVIEREV